MSCWAYQRFRSRKVSRVTGVLQIVSYTTSAVGTGYWFLQLLDRVSPSQWAAIGVLGSLLFGLLTYLTNLYFKIREDRRKAARGE
nr:class II holin family protein [Escherichia coli]